MALAALVASIVMVSTPPPPSPRPRASATASPTPSKAPNPVEIALSEVLDSERTLEDRTSALKRLSQTAHDAGPIVRALRRLESTSPAELQVRAMALTALERFPRDPAAREFLVVLAFRRDAARGERALALDVLASRPDLEQCRKPLKVLERDPEPAIRGRAKRILARMGPAPAPTASPPR